MMIKNSRGQSVIEFIVVMIIVIGALVAMSYYMKRGFQGRWKTIVDDMGEQYDPRRTNAEITYNTVANTSTHIMAIKDEGGFWTRRMDNSVSVTKVQGSSAVGAE